MTEVWCSEPRGDPSQTIYSRGMQNLPSRVNIGTGSISAARKLLLALSPCWSYQALSHDWAPNCCRSKTFFKTRTAAGCTKAQASLEVQGGVKAPFPLSGLCGNGESPKYRQLPLQPHQDLSARSRALGPCRDQEAQSCPCSVGQLPGAFLLSLMSSVCVRALFGACSLLPRERVETLGCPRADGAHRCLMDGGARAVPPPASCIPCWISGRRDSDWEDVANLEWSHFPLCPAPLWAGDDFPQGGGITITSSLQYAPPNIAGIGHVL